MVLVRGRQSELRNGEGNTELKTQIKNGRRHEKEIHDGDTKTSKGKDVMKVYRARRGKAPLILNVGTRWM